MSGSDEIESPTGTAPRGSPSPRPSETRTTSRTGSGLASDGRFTPGELLAERYRVVAMLGKGGMGEVYRADDLKLAQPVALKFLPESVSVDPERLDRFYNEVRVARQVSHANVCRVYDVGEIQGSHYLSMEFVDGEDLASLLRRIGRLPGDKAIEIARQLCAGLAAAHDRGVLHRDLKPENVMIDGRGKVRITDFGLASLADAIAGNDVRSGTPAYMSPEQLSGREVTARSDIYALGLVLYELFTGKRAFEGKTFVEFLRKHQDEPPKSPTEIVGDLDPAVESVILRCLEKDPLRRPASALGVAAGLPGGDPLAAALAAGETPSPELVAAAGESSGLARGRALGLALFCALGAIAYVPATPRLQPLHVFPFEKPPLVLADRAREILQDLGYPEAAADSAMGFSRDQDYVQYTIDRDRSMNRWDALASGRPPVLQFWYRQSPRPLISSSHLGRVFSANPPVTVSGMHGLWLDTKGRLVQFYAVPPQIEPKTKDITGAPDWSRLFLHARLELASFKPSASVWLPPFASDARAAWDGVFPERPEIPLHIEAAGYRGRAVYFLITAPWSRAEREQPFKPTREQIAASWAGTTLFLSALIASAILARHNLRLGRSDRRGALRLTSAAAVIALAQWALEANHVAELGPELGLLTRGAGLSFVYALLLGLVYLALEPSVRRLWPDALISWTRLLSGRWRDPLVASHALVGVAYGVAMTLVVGGCNALLMAAGDPPGFPNTFFIDALLGPVDTLRFALGRLLDSVMIALAMVLLFVGTRRVLRRQWLAGLVMLFLVSLPNALQSTTSPLVSIPSTMAILGFLVIALLREGVLSLIVTAFVVGLLGNLPLTLDMSKWYAQPTQSIFAILAALIIFGLRPSLRAETPPTRSAV